MGWDGGGDGASYLTKSDRAKFRCTCEAVDMQSSQVGVSIMKNMQNGLRERELLLEIWRIASTGGLSCRDG